MRKIGLAVLPHEDEHVPPPGHPENVHRLSLVIDELGDREKHPELTPLSKKSFGIEPVRRVHDGTYLDTLREMASAGGGQADPDTFVSAMSFDAALKVVNAILSAVDRAFAADPAASLVMGRPPGHHAGQQRAMGFCLINNVAVAAQHALDAHAAERVAIVDFDVHHGNGTQDIFYDRDDVLYISSHQYPFYPGTGSHGETGGGKGEGYTLNCPLQAGATDAQIIEVFDRAIVPALMSFRPDLLLVSAGFDAHRLDPLGGLAFTGEGFYRIARRLRQAADETCGGRLVSVLEGGYDPRGNLDSITNYIKGISDA
jgi:acetoin utilization deacetylase AcuC-like enzyme